MSLGGRVLTFQRHIVPLYLRVKGQVDEAVTLNDECTMFLCNFRTAALQNTVLPVTLQDRSTAEHCTASYTSGPQHCRTLYCQLHFCITITTIISYCCIQCYILSLTLMIIQGLKMCEIMAPKGKFGIVNVYLRGSKPFLW